MKGIIGIIFLLYFAFVIFTFNPLSKSQEPITPPTNQDAILMCPGEAPVYPDKWALEDGRIIIKLGKIYMIAPMQCGLVSLYPEAETKEASK